MLYFLLSGRAPFAAENPRAALGRAAHCDFDRLALAKRGVPRRLAAICLRAMSAEPAQRQATADELARDLDRYVRAPARRARAVGAAAVVSLVVALVSWSSHTSPESLTAKPIITAAQPLRVTVWQHDKPTDLASALPVRGGDDLQLRWQLPVGCHAALFWFDSEGKLLGPLDCEVTGEGPERELVWPRRGESEALGGPAGTELILLCATRTGAPTLADVVGPEFRDGPWPLLADRALLRLDRGAVRLEDARERGPGGPRRDRPEAELRTRADDLRRRLAERFEHVVGVAFLHAEEGGD